MNSNTPITITRPDDWHLHPRDGPAIALLRGRRHPSLSCLPPISRMCRAVRICPAIIEDARLAGMRSRAGGLRAGRFWSRGRWTDPPEAHAMLLTYEGDSVHANVEVGFEAINGWLELHQATGDARWLTAVLSPSSRLVLLPQQYIIPLAT